MSPYVRAVALFCVLLISSTVLAKDKPTPTPDDKGPTSQPDKPREGGPTSKPARQNEKIQIISMEDLMGEDTTGDLPPGLQKPKRDPATNVFEYLKPSPEQQKLWVQFHKQQTDEVLKKMPSLHVTLVETEHYLIYTNWPASDHKYLKDNLEALFTTFCKQFDIPSADAGKLFLGKLPVFCVETKEEFGRLSERGFGVPVAANTLGYCQPHPWGLVKLVLYRIEPYRGKSWRVRWVEVMSHEGTHAFVARYRSNRHIPAWMNEGLAEYFSCILAKMTAGSVATEQSDKVNESIRWVNRVARDELPLQSNLFNVDHSPEAEMYSAAWGITKMLIKQNPKAYVQMIKDLKDGVVTVSSSGGMPDNAATGEKALEKNFNCDYPKLEAVFRKWATTTAGEAQLRN